MNLSRRRGMTLIEAIVVMGIIGVLLALLLPATQAAREAGRRARCSNNLKQIAVAVASYQNAAGVLPGTYEDSWAIAVLPFLEQTRLYNEFNHSFPVASPENHTTSGHRLSVFTCPTEPDETLASGEVVGNYSLNAHVAGMSFNALSDGTSQTVLGSDIPSAWFLPWSVGPQSTSNLLGPSVHGERRLVAFIDGSVRSFPSRLFEPIAEALATPAGGEVVDLSP